MFDVGERVLCIKDWWGQCRPGHPHQLRWCPNLPRRGAIYTIRDLWPRGHLRLVEVVNPINGDGIEPVFEACNFVPLKRSATDIGFAHEILRKATGKVEV